ncbi:MAG: 23S rRNA (adenine(2503)-C(2))-methyltransferase RlmN [Rickettsiales bacterium]|jgi:23S rRNA (adenine2503-C2)-methyltransferase|nr:23S rRNA (adenine(2503)-C(2))-methyltransferase RlmN [Rickettsiales bacterium]
MVDIYNLNKSELSQELSIMGEKSYRAEQIWHWLYVKGVTKFSQMSNLSPSLQEKLDNHFTITRQKIAEKQESTDGTIKWLLKLEDGNKVEVVFIPEKTRGTLCISSQVGCTLTCSFCHTGTQRFVRNLTTSEVIGQLVLAKDELNDWHDSPKITNIVMMGMGEPLYNYDNVSKALKILMEQKGIDFARSRITLSTSGVVPMIDKCGEELGVHLAISLHAVNDELRNILVPLNKKYNIEELLNSCRNYPANRHHKITFEYVMLDGMNDSIEHAQKLTKLIKGIPAKINIIPFNPWPGSIYLCSSKEKIAAFAKEIRDAGYQALVRTPRGQDILAACGQLKTESERQSKSILCKT